MGTCCANRMSAYCPDCGADLHANPLAALLSHCRRQASNYEQRAMGGADHMVAAATKWRGFATALEALLEGGER